METDPVADAWLEEDAQRIEVPATASDFANDWAMHVALKSRQKKSSRHICVAPNSPTVNLGCDRRRTMTDPLSVAPSLCTTRRATLPSSDTDSARHFKAAKVFGFLEGKHRLQGATLVASRYCTET